METSPASRPACRLNNRRKNVYSSPKPLIRPPKQNLEERKGTAQSRLRGVRAFWTVKSAPMIAPI